MSGGVVRLLADAGDGAAKDTEGVNLLRCSLLAMPLGILFALLLWLAPPLRAVDAEADTIRGFYGDANALLRAVPAAAALGIVRVDGSDSWGRYLMRSSKGAPSVFNGEAMGWTFAKQDKNDIYTFTRGSERMVGACAPFSDEFAVCDVDYWSEPKH